MASKEHAATMRAGITRLIIFAAIVGIAVLADFGHHHGAKRVTVQEAAN